MGHANVYARNGLFYMKPRGNRRPVVRWSQNSFQKRVWQHRLWEMLYLATTRDFGFCGDAHWQTVAEGLGVDGVRHSYTEVGIVWKGMRD